MQTMLPASHCWISLLTQPWLAAFVVCWRSAKSIFALLSSPAKDYLSSLNTLRSDWHSTYQPFKALAAARRGRKRAASWKHDCCEEGLVYESLWNWVLLMFLKSLQPVDATHCLPPAVDPKTPWVKTLKLCFRCCFRWNWSCFAGGINLCADVWRRLLCAGS